jgi:hypothetical protein
MHGEDSPQVRGDGDPLPVKPNDEWHLSGYGNARSMASAKAFAVNGFVRYAMQS